MTTQDQHAIAGNVLLLPQPAEGSQICSLSLFQDQIFAGLTWLATEHEPGRASIRKCGINDIQFSDVTNSEPDTQTRTSGHACWHTGCHAMTVFGSRTDSSTALYASMFTPTGCNLIRTVDGESIEMLPLIADGVLVHSMTAFDGQLFVAAYVENQGPVIYYSDNPTKGKWQQVAEAGFGDAGNVSISSMAEFNGCLYVATFNPRSGFQLWCASVEGEATYSWNQVVTGGALRYTLNPAIMSMTVFDGALYIGTGPTGINVYGYDLNPAAAELIRIFPDNNWELVVGSPRFSPDGLKVPMAAMGPGFDNRNNTAITAMAVHDDQLYVTTGATGYNNTRLGDCCLWSTADGDEWQAVATDIPETMNAMIIRAIIPTPNNLLLATSDSDSSCQFSEVALKLSAKRKAKEPSLLQMAKSFLSK